MTVIEGSWPEQREDGGRKGTKIKKKKEKKKAGMEGVRDEKKEGGRGETIHLRPRDVEWHITGLMCN